MEGGMIMSVLSSDLIKEFVKNTHDESKDKTPFEANSWNRLTKDEAASCKSDGKIRSV